jgi:hypothetical protein
MTIEPNSLTGASQFRVHPTKPHILQVKTAPGARWRPHSRWRDAEEARAMLLRLGGTDAQGEAQTTK